MKLRTHTLGVVTLLTVGACEDPATDPTVPPPEPPSAVATTAQLASIRVEWRDESTDEIAFVVARAEFSSVDGALNLSELVELATVAADQEFYRDLEVTEGRYYAYAVAALNAGGRSRWTVMTGPNQSPLAVVAATGCSVTDGSATDVDGDGISNDVEAAGWLVRVDETGAGGFSELVVSSDPRRADSDDDGLCDALERRIRTNPLVRDTDGDGLDDEAEVRTWGSSPTNVDSDGDAAGNSAYFDGSELARFGTSPTLADTDGDGRSDFEEINQNGTSALLADLPQPVIELPGSIDIGLTVTRSDSTSSSGRYATTLATSTEASRGLTTTEASTFTFSVSNELEVAAEATFPSTLSGSIATTSTVDLGFVRDQGLSFDEASSSGARTNYDRAVSDTTSRSETITGGTISTELRIRNAGDRTFQLDDFVATVLNRSGSTPDSFSTVTSLQLPAAANGLVLGPGQSAGPFRVSGELGADDAIDLLANPSGLFLAPASYELVDAPGQAFEFTIGETTAARTASITIDYDGARPPETHHVATNVRRTAGGVVQGVALAEALERIVGLTPGTDFEVTATSAGRRVLTGVRGVESVGSGARSDAFWVVLGAENGTSATPVGERLLDPTLDFEDLLLMPRDHVYLVYVADRDHDGLFSREERFHRTSDQLEDTDGDGLTDVDEVRDGWTVTTDRGLYRQGLRVYPDPRAADADGDGLDDVAERSKGTDPKRADTDADGRPDGTDAEPLRSNVATPYLHVVGTVGGERPLAVGTDDAGHVVVYGSVSGVDLDGDGQFSLLPTSRFVASYDATGRRRWVHEFENPPTATPVLNAGVVGPDGTTYVLDRARTGSPQLLTIRPDGTEAAPVALTAPGTAAFAEWNGLREVTRLERTSDGHFVLLGRGTWPLYPALNIIDPTGAVVASLVDSVRASTYDCLAACSAGILTCGASGSSVYGGTLPAFAWPFGDSIGLFNFTTSPESRPFQLDVSDSLTMWMVDDLATVSRRDDTTDFANDGFTWRSFSAGASPQLRAFAHGESDRFVVAAEVGAGELELRLLDASGQPVFTHAIPHLEDVVVHEGGSAGVVVVGSAVGGYAGRPGYGVEDLVILRNPHQLE